MSRARVATSISCRTRRVTRRWTWSCPTRSVSAAPTVRWSSVALDAGGKAESLSVHIRKLPGRHDLSALAARFPARYPCLLESVAHGTPTSRWDLLPAFPARRLMLDGDGRLTLDGVAQGSADF